MLESKYVKNVFMGSAISGIEIIDCHCHIGTMSAQYIPYEGNPEGLISMMDRLGVTGACISHIMGIREDVGEGNRLVCEAADKYSGRLHAYLCYNAHYSQEQGLGYLERDYQKPGVVGLKIYTTAHFTQPDDPR